MTKRSYLLSTKQLICAIICALAMGLVLMAPQAALADDIICEPTDGGSVSSTPDGDKMSYEATPNAGYEFDKWVYEEKVSEDATETKESSDNPLVLTADDTVTRACFKLKELSVTVSDDGKGSATANPTKGTKGTEITLSATPNAGYKFSEWQVVSGGVSVSGSKFQIGTEDVEVKACFEPITYTVTYKIKNGLWSDSSTGNFSEQVAHGASPAKIPTGMKPNKGYGGGSWDAQPQGATITADKTFTYSFTAKKYTIKFVNHNGKTLQSNKVAYGKTPKYTGKTPTKSPDSKYSYKFKGWSPKIAKVSGNATYKATFSKVAKKAKISYSLASGGDTTWTKGATTAQSFTFKRSTDDSTSFKHFKGVKVDGREVAEKNASGQANYTVRSGSVIVSLQPAYLETLSVGKHSLTAVFDDASDVSASFSVAAKTAGTPAGTNNNSKSSASSTSTTGKATTVPKAGDTLSGLGLVAGIALASGIAALGFALASRRRNDGADIEALRRRSGF